MENLDYQKHQLADLEELLASTLKPVQLRPQFVRELRHRLMDTSIPSVVEKRVPTSHYALLVIASIISGTFLVVAGSKAVATFLGTLGVLSFMKSKVDQQRSAPAQERVV
jgi:hypothetical protein